MNLSPQYGKCSSYWNIVFFWSTRQWKVSTNWVINKVHTIRLVIRCIHRIVKSNYYQHHVCLIGMTQLPLCVFSWFFGGGGEIYWENSSFIKVRQEWMVLHIHFWSYLTQIFLEWEMFQTEDVQKIKTHFIFSNFFFNHVIDEIMWKNVVELDGS